MSLTSSVARTQANALSSRAALCRLPPRTTSAGPPVSATPSPFVASKPPTALHVTSQYEHSPCFISSPRPHLELSFSSHDPSQSDHERKTKLGKTLRILQERLPTLLQSPLPQEILSPNISLHLFPSTHPYLPAVSGRVAYIAALWTSPLAWNRVPIIGNVKLVILSERMVSGSALYSPKRPGACGEKLVVKWRTATSSKAKTSDLSLAEQGEQKLDSTLRGTQDAGEKKAFTGLFIFEFDRDGKVLSHTIEHVDEHGEWEKGVGAKVVGLTDWLLGGIKGRTDGGSPVPAFETLDRRSRKTAG
ncbi:hypothetical protein F4778DRAFT_743060 [Xylariomycetidae sp. FL2044]|nr:hypothetical protein F4778DRAFT_743060 [Xylariomycetidae sp. FL2044]